MFICLYPTRSMSFFFFFFCPLLGLGTSSALLSSAQGADLFFMPIHQAAVPFWWRSLESQISDHVSAWLVPVWRALFGRTGENFLDLRTHVATHVALFCCWDLQSFYFPLPQLCNS